jgi:hypothetical protein
MALIRPLERGDASGAKRNRSHNRKNVEDQHGKNNVIEKLPVAAGNAEQARPYHLHHQRNCGGFVFAGCSLDTLRKNKPSFAIA